MVELQAVLFDVDGTLANTEAAHLQAFNDTFSEQDLGWNWSANEYLQLLDITGGKERMLHFIETTDAPIPKHVTDLKVFVAELHTAKTLQYQNLLAQGRLPLRTGVKRLILEARQTGLALAIATTTSRLNVKLLIELNLGQQAWSWFSVVGAGEDVDQKKPHPEVYEFVLRALALESTACIALEDSSNGLVAANAANLACMITVNEFTQQQSFTTADIVLDNFGEPTNSFAVLQGNAAGFTHVNVEMLRHVHSQHI